jgi:PQQ-dependent catabolism-associated CXXCW motif protein
MLRIALLLACLVPGAALAQAVAEPPGYREAPYRAPTPAGLSGATTVGTEEARRLWEEGVTTFIDVLPREERPPDLPEGTIWRDRPHDSIPGATWLPNVGYAALSPEEAAYFEGGLAAATGGDPSRPVLFFCREECWMSWNAAKRALAMGYSDVYWFPGGTDGWARAGFATERLDPLDRP